MFKILLPYDGSEPAEHALSVVFDRFDPDMVTVLFVFDPAEAGYDAPDPFGTDTELEQLATDQSETVLADLDVPTDSETTVRTTHQIGHPARTVVNYADDEAVDHVVIGSHGRAGVSRLLLGSVAEKVVRRSPVPVTVVR
ncbi:universal stress protein [Halorubrum coriense]|uniref:universal stress protein n=1 Tax=Halorubrum coriense TaxID=64713 RepID=UPI000677C991|nr:universal stress protein [Halorubrum coriense]